MTKIAFISLLATAFFLAVVSLFPERTDLYTSPLALVIWSVTAVAALYAILRVKLWRRPAIFTLHLAFFVILAGALVSHLCGESERVHMKVGEARMIGNAMIGLIDFNIEYYPATSAPADFVAYIVVNGGEKIKVSMNHTADAAGCRLFLSSYDDNRSGCSFIVARDKAGTAISYVGYALLLLSMLAVSCKVKKKRAIAAILFGTVITCASAAPQSVPKGVADSLGNLCVLHDGRVAPLSTLARDFTLKIYGADSYNGFSSEQVLAGWLFYYDTWKNDRGIKIKDADARRQMGLENNRACIADFFDLNGYLFDDPDHAEANEKFALVSAAAAGSLWKIFPYRADSINVISPVIWYSPVDQLPESLDIDSWRMTRHSMGYLAELVANENWDEAINVIGKIGKYQQQKCPESLPAYGRIKAERIFLAFSASPWPMILLLIFGVILIIYPHYILSRCLLILGILWIAVLVCLNAYASRHLPMSNGYETMQWMALFSMVVCLWLGRKQPAVMSLGAIVAAMALAVAMMGQRNPQITNLMPVLRSPLLSIHVLTVMLAYALFAVMALISCLWLCGRRELLSMARVLLQPAVFFLAAGIFIGAVWANMSWGRYWGWDPKEVWALITMMVYCVPLHGSSLPMFRSDRVFAIWILASFATVIMTYLGVNFILGGLHSYA